MRIFVFVMLLTFAFVACDRKNNDMPVSGIAYEKSDTTPAPDVNMPEPIPEPASAPHPTPTHEPTPAPIRNPNLPRDVRPDVSLIVESSYSIESEISDGVLTVVIYDAMLEPYFDLGKDDTLILDYRVFVHNEFFGVQGRQQGGVFDTETMSFWYDSELFLDGSVSYDFPGRNIIFKLTFNEESSTYEVFMCKHSPFYLATYTRFLDGSEENRWASPIIVYGPVPPQPNLPFIDNEADISDFGRQVAEEFLSRYITIFTGIPVLMEDQRFSHWVRSENGWIETFTDAVPFLYTHYGRIETVYNRQGEIVRRIEPFLFNDEAEGWYISGFGLIYLGNNGIPDILLYSDILWATGGIPYEGVLYRYIDGAYTPVHPSDATSALYAEAYFQTDSGRYVAFTATQEYDEGANLLYVDFNDDATVNTELIAEGYNRSFGAEFWQWNNVLNGESERLIVRTYDGGFLMGTIPGMPNETLARIRPLTSLKNEITESVTRRLIEEGIILEG
ncbi:MAG: hypothetical protein LBI27_09955 [Clostridiales bacterium]|jgi:hypothetical protein|nr:hypothetical protein [Clostridiales bacterium]